MLWRFLQGCRGVGDAAEVLQSVPGLEAHNAGVKNKECTKFKVLEYIVHKVQYS